MKQAIACILIVMATFGFAMQGNCREKKKNTAKRGPQSIGR